LEQRELAAKNLLLQLKKLPFYQAAQHIALYLENDAEISTQFILEDALALKKNCYLPILSAEPNNFLSFMPYQRDTLLVANQFGILEPVFVSEQAISPQQLDLVLCPLVAFDQQGNRLGMGGGFYDRTFAFTKQTLSAARPLIGLAYELQQVSQIPHDDWDVALTGVVTDTHYYDCN
jgi:5-formyltetrahydrofolate cyclo-ligase